MNEFINWLRYHHSLGIEEVIFPHDWESLLKKGHELLIEGRKISIRGQARDDRMNARGNKENIMTLPDNLKKLEKTVSVCTKCQLCEGRTQTVFGVGNTKSQLMFVGEAPGRDEDIRGEPFVGRAGQLLGKIINAMGYQRSDVYIANVVKCRPPNNRGPFPVEVESCMPYLLKQIELIKPQILVGLGSYAVKSLLKSEEPISKLRGRFFDFHGIQLMATFHPAYLLRNPNMKKLVWEDMQKVMAHIKESKK